MIPLSAKAIVRNGRLALFLRNPRDEWESPVGWPEAAESLEETVMREVQDECGIVALAIRYVASRSCEVVPGKRVPIACCQFQVDRHEVVLSDEHNRFGWIDLDADKPANLPDFYWTFCRRADPGARTAPVPAPSRLQGGGCNRVRSITRTVGV